MQHADETALKVAELQAEIAKLQAAEYNTVQGGVGTVAPLPVEPSRQGGYLDIRKAPHFSSL